MKMVKQSISRFDIKNGDIIGFKYHSNIPEADYKGFILFTGNSSSSETGVTFGAFGVNMGYLTPNVAFQQHSKIFPTQRDVAIWLYARYGVRKFYRFHILTDLYRWLSKPVIV